jgi:hypothetical protein
MGGWRLRFPKYFCPTCGTKLERFDANAPVGESVGCWTYFVWTAVAGVLSVITGNLFGEVVGLLVALLTAAGILAFSTPRYWCDSCKRIVRREDVNAAPSEDVACENLTPA